MENDNQEPTSPAEPQGTLLNTDEITEWGRDKVFVGVKEDQPDEPEEPEAPEPEDDDDDNDPLPPAVKTAPDPGEFKPGDYAFEVMVYDEEGKNGKTVKIKSVEQFEELLDKEANFGSAAALLKAQRLAVKMESNLDRDKAKHDELKAKYEQEQQAVQAQTQATNRMVAEINYLVKRGDLPEVAKEYQNADWADEEVAKQPGVKEQIKLLNYMRKENIAREKVGLAPITSILDAFNAFTIDQAKHQAKDAKKTAGEARKQAGARVAGSSPAPVSAVPKGLMVGRVNTPNADVWG